MLIGDSCNDLLANPKTTWNYRQCKRLFGQPEHRAEDTKETRNSEKFPRILRLEQVHLKGSWPSCPFPPMEALDRLILGEAERVVVAGVLAVGFGRVFFE